LKIDREFIKAIPSNLSDCQLVSASILMAHGLGMMVVAEGVETEEQSHYLVNNDCDLIQGYLFSKPKPPEALIEMLKSSAVN
jgi:EAL domain-containing protein (putative c-di-GMP-specific phosphodiesterase class I)